MRVPRLVDRIWRRKFGTHAIDDPRPIAAEAPYTYYLPSPDALSAIEPGDLVKVIVRSVPPSRDWDAERMWVKVAQADGDVLSGELANLPFDIPQLKPGSPLMFPRSAVIDIIWDEERIKPPPASPPRREFWDRCLVDDCVLYGRSPVDYIYREEPDMVVPEDKYPDSGWRIRGTDEAIAEDETTERSPHYVALGAVLNRDDSWLDLIDAPIGARFIRDLDTGKFVPCEAEDQ